MKVVKITTKNDDVFYCRPGQQVQVDNHAEIGAWEYVEMTEEEFAAIPATTESAKFFG